MYVVYKEVPKLCFISHEVDLAHVDCVGAEGARNGREPSESEQRRSETRDVPPNQPKPVETGFEKVYTWSGNLS